MPRILVPPRRGRGRRRRAGGRGVRRRARSATADEPAALAEPARPSAAILRPRVSASARDSLRGDGGHRLDTAGGADARPDRHQRGRGADEDPRQVPARDRERGVGPAPGPVYVKSFLRTYGDFLGLDSRHADRRVQAPLRAARRTTSCGRSRTLGRERERAAPRARCCRRGRSSAWCSSAVVVVAVLHRHRATSNKPPATRPARTPGSTAQHSTAPSRAATRRGAEADARSSSSSCPPAAVYVCLVDGDRQEADPGQIFNAGQTIPIQTASKLLLTLGNASVQMKVNGKPVPVGAVAELDRLQLITPSGDAHRCCHRSQARAARAR